MLSDDCMEWIDKMIYDDVLMKKLTREGDTCGQQLSGAAIFSVLISNILLRRVPTAAGFFAGHFQCSYRCTFPEARASQLITIQWPCGHVPLGIIHSIYSRDEFVIDVSSRPQRSKPPLSTRGRLFWMCARQYSAPSATHLVSSDMG